MTPTADPIALTLETAGRALWLFACCGSAFAALAAESEARACLLLSLFWAALAPCLLSAGADEAALFAGVTAAAGWALIHLHDAPPSEPPAPPRPHLLRERALRGLPPCLLSALAAGTLTALLTDAPPVFSAPEAAKLYESAADYMARRPQDALALFCLTAVTLLGASVPCDQPKGDADAA